MDKSWMSMPRTTLEYMNGLHTFLNFSFSSPCCQDGKILCPCKTCFNRHWMSRKDAFEHLICVGFVKNYTHWVLHGESSFHASSSMPNEDHENVGINNDVEDLLNDMARSVQPEAHTEEPNADALKFYKLVDANQTELYPGCTRHSKLSFIIRLFHVKCLGRWSVKSFTMLLELLREVIPNGENLPKSYHEVKKFISDLGLSYETIDACRNDCMLFWKNHINESNCLICGADRWKSTPSNAVGTAKKKTHNVPFKRLRYFPLGPRLQRLFMSADTATLMRWHAEKRADDGILRHPADSPAWKTFDYRHQEFATQPRNVRLGLASDGFNPFRSMNLSHSTWPVVMVPYNLPPWLYMKQPYMFLSLLIPGPQSPGNDIDVYLQPLVEELKDLWYNGIETYDASLKQNFQMKAALMWTISDFPGYAMLSGWSTKGRLACPACNKQTHSQWLKYGRKFCYLGHRRFLPSRHVFRRYKKSFDNQQEFRPAPKPLSGSDVLADLQGRQITFGKKSKNNHLPYAWKKRSIFFDLPYWVDNLLRHNLDVMHIEKNVCDNILWTLLNVNGRSKDSVKSRLDLQLMGIRGELHPQRHESGKMYVPPSCFTLSAKERLLLCKALKGVKVPDGYASNISRCVNIKQRKIAPFKSHDSHILMQQLLPLMIRRLLPKPISGPLIQLCSFFKDLCSKTGEIDKLNNLEHQISLTLCQLERIFPPSFFDVMVHLTVHLVSEVKLGGPVQGRWMYPIERFLSTLKSYVGNKAQPEGSITEGYLAEECLTFCSRYLKGVETRLNRTPRNEDNNTYGADIVNQEEVNSFFHHSGRPIGKGDLVIMDNETLAKAHQYVLANCPLVNPFIEQHLALLRSQYPRATPHTIHAKHHATFQSWFANQIMFGTNLSTENLEELKHLARSPNNVVKKFNGFVINGYRFQNKEMEKKRKTQNSGVMLTATTQSFASTRDRNPVYSDIIYYGVIQEIVELEYWINRKIVLFKCDWVSNSRGIKQDDFGFTLVNFSRRMSENEPFILARQAQQVFYVADTVDKEWEVVIKTTPRNLCDLSEQELVVDVETYLQSETLNAAFSEDVTHEDDVTWTRDGMHGDLVDATVENPVGEPSSIQEIEGEDSEVNENVAYDY